MGFGNTPSPPLPFWETVVGRVKRENRKKCPITQGDNRITGATANTLWLRHSKQNAYSNRKIYFFVQR